MAWVNNAPELLVPVPLASPVIGLMPLPHTPLLLLASTKSLVVLHDSSFLPLAYHNRPDDCVSQRGPTSRLNVFHFSVNTASNEQIRSASFCLGTESNFILMYQIALNYSNSRYEITDLTNLDNVLQNNLPLLHNNAKHSLTSMLKSATRTLGLNQENAMVNIEHFENGTYDDETRNENIPLVRLSLVRILKLTSPLRCIWTKPNSHTLIFYNAANQIQVHNKESSHTMDLTKCDWFVDTLTMAYSPTHHIFMHVGSNLEVSILELKNADSIQIKHTVIHKLEAAPSSIIFNPQHDLFLLHYSFHLGIYLLHVDSDKALSMRLIKSVLKVPKSESIKVEWSPCGDFFTIIDEPTAYFKIISKFGFVLFDSALVGTEISTANMSTSILNRSTDFCRVSFCTVSSNGHLLYLVNHEKTRLYLVRLLRSSKGILEVPILYDLNYISFPAQRRASHFHRIPLLPLMQNVFSKMQLLNGVSKTDSFKKSTGVLSIGKNAFTQTSIAYGSHVAVSTPTSLGSESNHALWFQLYNHFTDPLNVVGHFWIRDYLVLINRYEKGEAKNAAAFPERTVDELMIVSTASSKFGAGGVEFKFDSDLIAWRHTFNNRIIAHELSETNKDMYLLTLLTSDHKIVMMEVKIASSNSPDRPTEIKLGSSRISINVCRTIHLSSIRNKLPIGSIEKLVTVKERHFLFLLSTGDVYLLKNQIANAVSTPSNNMYELKRIGSSVEYMQVFDINFEDGDRKYVSLFTGNALMIYDLMKLTSDDGCEHGVDLRDDDLLEKDLGEALGADGQIPDFDVQIRPIIIPVSSYMPLCIAPSKTSIEVLNLEYQITSKNEHLVIKHKTNRQLILNRFIGHDLFVAGLEVEAITKKYKSFSNYIYCLELLLYEYLTDLASDENLVKICALVSKSSSADAIYVNLLRKIEVHYWSRFFNLLKQTPVGLMDNLISLNNVELSYNYLIIYLNYKRESVSVETAEQATVLNEKERNVITEIIRMLLEAEMWAESYELCRFIKLLEPLNELLGRIQDLL